MFLCCYVGRTHIYVNTMADEHLTDNTSTIIFKQINANVGCKAMCYRDCIKNIDQASTQHERNAEEGTHINGWDLIYICERNTKSTHH